MRKLLFRLLFGRPYAVFTPQAPKPVGPYSQAIVYGSLVFAAGQLGIDPVTGTLVSPTAEGQMEQALKNMRAVLQAAGSDVSQVVKVTVYFRDLNHYGPVNAVYERFFQGNKPARSAVEVPRIPLDALIELDYFAVR